MNKKKTTEIRLITPAEFPEALDIIHAAFATIADEFGLSRENCPRYTAYMPIENLENQFNRGWMMFGFFADGKITGYFSLSKEGVGLFELHNLAVCPEYRHCGFGGMMLDFAKKKVIESGGSILKLSIIEENERIKKFYSANGFTHTGIKKYPHLPFTSGYMEWIK